MEEQKTTETQQPTANTGDGNQPEAVNVIDRADSIRKGLASDIEKYEKIAQRIEQAAARMMLGGKSEAGLPQKSQEEINNEIVDKQVKETMKRFGLRT